MNRTFSGTPLIRLGYLLALLSAPALAWLVRRQGGARGIYLIVVIGRAKLMRERFDRAAAAGFDPPLGQSICSQASWFVEIAAPD